MISPGLRLSSVMQTVVLMRSMSEIFMLIDILNRQSLNYQYRNASFIAGNRVVFNIKGNTYRLVVAVAYSFGAVYVKFIGSHAAYDRIDACTVQLEE
jgi:hypothetical protein